MPEQPHITEVDNMVQDLVREAYELWGIPWYLQKLSDFGFWFYCTIGFAGIWGLSRKLIDRHRHNTYNLCVASDLAHLVIRAQQHAVLYGLSEPNKEFIVKYDKYLELD